MDGGGGNSWRESREVFSVYVTRTLVNQERQDRNMVQALSHCPSLDREFGLVDTSRAPASQVPNAL